ncbi:hypothetical protein [Hymenobacter qilianensis]|uniref:hypothetical protein n=1 Tax=Hymenobacter qilianensis TaxID=1385715 RepID=UPI00293BDCB6|nr:hypothetical protein [Hymenobacter qilianensis]
MVQELPVKSKAKAARTRYFHYMVLRYDDTIYLRKRTDKDIWQGLYDFALTETDSPDLPPPTCSMRWKLWGANWTPAAYRNRLTRPGMC